MGKNLFNYIMAAPRVVEPQADCRDDRLVVLELASRMGLKSPWQTVADFNNWRLEKVGIKFDELAAMPDSILAFPVQYRSYEKRGFLTPSGKVELYSSVLEKAGYDPLPRYIEPPESPVTTPGLAREYPFILTTFRHKAYEHTEYRQIASLRRLLPEPLIEINPDSAAGLGISEGETVWLSTPGLPYRVRGKARLVPGLHPNVVGSLFGWWFPEEPGPEHRCFEANVNAIIAAGPPYEPVNGNYHARGVLCRVERQSTGSPSR